MSMRGTSGTEKYNYSDSTENGWEAFWTTLYQHSTLLLTYFASIKVFDIIRVLLKRDYYLQCGTETMHSLW